MKKILLVSVFLLAFSLTASTASARGVWFGLNLPLFSFGVGLGSPYYGGYGSGYNGGYYGPSYNGGYYRSGYNGGYYRPGYNGGYYGPSYNGGYYRPGYYRYRAPYYR